MTYSTSRALHPMPGLAWTEIRNEATAFADRGWPVLPGTYQLSETGAWLGKPRSTGLEPIAEVWTMAATTDPTIAADWWTQRPYSVLLACGILIDAFEIPTQHHKPTMEHLRSYRVLGPVAVTPHGSMLLFARTSMIQPNQQLPPQIRWHSADSWVALPPTVAAGIPYRWHHWPQEVGWRLPDASRVHRALTELHPIPDTAQPNPAE